MKPILFNRGIPAPESFGIDNVVRAARDVLAEHGTALLQYGPSQGLAPLREWLAAWQGVTADQVILGNGSLQLLDFLCMGLLEPGDLVFTEAPTYDRTLTLLRRHGARVVGIPLDADGPDLDRLEAELAKARPRFFYVIPDFQNPAGATCSGAKRRRIAELAEAHDFLIVEDAPYRQLRYRGVEERSLYSLAPERTIQMSSFSKLIGPGPRVGFLIGAAETLKKVAKLAEDTYICPNNLAHGIAYEWCRRGLLPLQIERLRALYAPAARRLPGRPRAAPARGRGHAARGRLLRVVDPSRGHVYDGRPRSGRGRVSCSSPTAPPSSRTAAASASFACRSAPSLRRRSRKASAAWARPCARLRGGRGRLDSDYS